MKFTLECSRGSTYLNRATWKDKETLDIVSEMNNKALQLPKTGEIQASMVLELMIALYNA